MCSVHRVTCTLVNQSPNTGPLSGIISDPPVTGLHQHPHQPPATAACAAHGDSVHLWPPVNPCPLLQWTAAYTEEWVNTTFYHFIGDRLPAKQEAAGAPVTPVTSPAGNQCQTRCGPDYLYSESYAKRLGHVLQTALLDNDISQCMFSLLAIPGLTVWYPRHIHLDINSAARLECSRCHACLRHSNSN